MADELKLPDGWGGWPRVTYPVLRSNTRTAPCVLRCPSCDTPFERSLTEAMMEQFFIKTADGAWAYQLGPDGEVCSLCWEAEKEYQRVRMIVERS